MDLCEVVHIALIKYHLNFQTSQTFIRFIQIKKSNVIETHCSI